jgi:hypothetical protein
LYTSRIRAIIDPMMKMMGIMWQTISKQNPRNSDVIQSSSNPITNPVTEVYGKVYHSSQYIKQ